MHSFRPIAVVTILGLSLASPPQASAVPLNASFESWVRDDGATLADRDDDLVSVWSSVGSTARWGVVEFDLSSLAGITVSSVWLDLWSQPFGFSDDNFPIKQTAAVINPTGATSSLNWAGITALSQTALQTLGAYDLPPVNGNPAIANKFIPSSGSALDLSTVQQELDSDGILTIVMMAAEDGTVYRNSWGDGAYGGMKPRLWINETPPEQVDLTLEVGTLSGHIEIVNPGLVTTFQLDGYVIHSEAGSLKTAWKSFTDQSMPGWQEVAPTSNDLSEVNLTGSLEIGPGERVTLQNAFTPGGQTDISFFYNLEGIGTRQGLVNYVTTQPSNGDYDDDGDVDGSDFLVWQRSLGSQDDAADGDESGTVDAGDLTVWRNTFGSSATVAMANAVPEPSSCLVAVVGGLVTWRRRRIARVA